MNIFNGKVVAIKDGQFGPWMPGIAVGGVVRTGDNFVSGALNQELTGTLKAYTNGDVYVAATKTWLKPPVPFLAELRLEGHQCLDLRASAGRRRGLAGGCSAAWAFRCPSATIVPLCPRRILRRSRQPPRTWAQSLHQRLSVAAARAHLPTTLDYAVRVTQKEHPHFAFDIGVGQVAGNIGTTRSQPHYPPSRMLRRT